jgi:hypothetical protein
MKTKIIFFDNVREVKARALSLPKVVIINNELWGELLCMHGEQIKIDTDHIYIDRWTCTDKNLVIPDFARVENCTYGFYLEQTEQMQVIRNETYQCSLCDEQYHTYTVPFCLECLHREDLTADTLYKLFLRPVATFDIDLNHKSIHVPKWLKDLYDDRNIETMGFDPKKFYSLPSDEGTQEYLSI